MTVAVPDETRGEEVKASIVLDPGTELLPRHRPVAMTSGPTCKGTLQ